jgi:hypothetical protein
MLGKKLKGGFGLLEVTIAAGVAAGLAMTAYKMNETQKKAMSKISFNFDIVEAQKTIIKVLGDKAACNHTLQGKFFKPSPPNFINEIKNNDGKIAIYSTANKNTGGSFKIKSIEIKNIDAPTTTSGQGRINLILTFERLKMTIDNTNLTQTKSVPLIVRTSGGFKIDECFGDATASLETARDEVDILTQESFGPLNDKILHLKNRLQQIKSINSLL